MSEIIDATVVDQPYDMSGNGGRKLVMLENGWLVAVLKASTTRIDFYVSKDNGETWNLLCYQDGAQSADFPAIESYGTTIYFLVTRTGNRTSFATFDATLMNGQNIYDLVNFIITESASQNNTLVVNGDGTELHAAWASRNSTYPNSFNIRYVKGMINDDGSVSWGVVEQVSTDNTSNVHTQNPSIVVNGFGYPIIICERYTNGAFYNIFSYYYNGSTWSYREVYYGGVYNQSFPSAIFVQQEIAIKNSMFASATQGVIVVFWHGGDNTETTNHVRVSYSLDGGVTWSAMEKLTNGSQRRWYVSPTFNKNGVIDVLFSAHDSTNEQVAKITNNGTWGALTFVTNLTTTVNSPTYPSTLVDDSLNTTTPLFIYKDSSKVGFYGTWTTTEISVPQGDIGIKTDKSNLLTYSITSDEMSEITEKINGEVISRKTLSSGEETQVSLTQEQWDKIKYGKYAPNWNNIIPEFDATSFQYFNNSYAEDRVSLVVFDEGEAGGYVPVIPNKKYCFRFTHFSDDINLDFYVSSGNYLDGVYEEVKSHINERINLNTGKSLEDNFKEYTFVPESNYVFIKFSAWGWGNYDEASIMYMSLVNSFIDNTLAIEMGENKWEYTFDKRLADDANIHEIVKATKEANEIVLPTKKTKIVEAINEIGGNANDDDDLEELADRIRILDGSIMRYASGTCTSSTATLPFQYAGTTETYSTRFVEITDIPFIPSKITLSFKNSAGTIVYKTYYEEDDDPFYPKTIKLSTYQVQTSTIATYNFKGDVSNAVVSENLVRLPVNVGGNATGTWEAWG